eukprot:scaffold33903_cov62-Phaeocystis_antarctica.AAC.4
MPVDLRTHTNEPVFCCAQLQSPLAVPGAAAHVGSHGTGPHARHAWPAVITYGSSTLDYGCRCSKSAAARAQSARSKVEEQGE